MATTTHIEFRGGTYHLSRWGAKRLFPDEVASVHEVDGEWVAEINKTEEGEGTPWTEYAKYRSQLKEGEKLFIEIVTSYGDKDTRTVRPSY